MKKASRYAGIILTISIAPTLSRETEKAERADESIITTIRADAAKLEPFVKSRLAKDFLNAANRLPDKSVRTVYRNEDKSEYWSERSAAQLSKDQRDKLEKVQLPQQFYYYTVFGTPLAYCRALDLAAQSGFKSVEGKRILDFGYGTIGHLRMLASLGADVTGVEVYAILPAIYDEPDDRGFIKNPNGQTGHISLVQGRWPGEFNARSSIGTGYDLITSKNTLKNGYINPEKEVDPRMLVDLGVSNEQYVRAVYTALNPGGLFVIYNLYPAQNPEGEQYLPWADGRCPFPREMLEKIGFEIIAFDINDDKKAREMGKILGWDKTERPMDLENDLFGLYTILRKPPS